jgi:hypothetical protein
MINGVSIPVLTPYKFNPISPTIGNGVNFQNTDNTPQPEQEWEGVYHNGFVQPVPRFWNDYTPGLDFEIYLDTSILSIANLKSDLVDLNDNVVQSLTIDTIFSFSATEKQMRIYADKLLGVADGCYQIKIYENGGDDMYLSEVIRLAETIDDCYPLEYSNFENDFGVIFDGAPDDWTGKILIPLRLFKPEPQDEREIYQNDGGGLTTLRSVPKRVLELQSFPVPTWYAEKVKMIFNCSDLILNKYEVNTEETPEVEIIGESDKMEIVGPVQLNGFSEDYFYDDNLNTVTELLTSWTDVGWDTFNDTGKDIDEAEAQLVVATATSNNIAVTSNNWYLLKFDITSFSDATPTLTITLVGPTDITLTLDDSFESKSYYVMYKAVATGNLTIKITTKNTETTHFESICSFFKIT